MKSALASLLLLPMVSADMTKLTDAFVGAFGHASDFTGSGQILLYACLQDTIDYATDTTLYLTKPSLGYEIGTGTTFCDNGVCGTCAAGTQAGYFYIDKQANVDCGDGPEVAIKGFAWREGAVVNNSPPQFEYTRIEISNGLNGDTVITTNDGGLPFGGWYFASAFQTGETCTHDVTVTVTPPPPPTPASCGDATTVAQYQNMGCCSC